MEQYRAHLSQADVSPPPPPPPCVRFIHCYCFPFQVLPIDLSVTVMTANSWPVAYSGTSCNFPQELETRCKHFERFYLGKHSGRRLTWQPAHGHADLSVQFNARPLVLNVSTYAMVVLLLFESLGEGEVLTYEVRYPSLGVMGSSLTSTQGTEDDHWNRRARPKTEPPIPRLRPQAQDPHQTPLLARNQRKRHLLLQRGFHEQDDKGED